MRIYEGSPRQDFEEVFRSIGAFLDQRGMRDILLVEAPDGFIVQGLVMTSGGSGGWNEGMGTQVKETLTFLDEDIARFMDEAASRRGKDVPTAPHVAGQYENAFRVLGRYMDEQQPKDVFFFEQDGAFVVRLLHSTQAGHHHEATDDLFALPRLTVTSQYDGEALVSLLHHHSGRMDRVHSAMRSGISYALRRSGAKKRDSVAYSRALT